MSEILAAVYVSADAALRMDAGGSFSVSAIVEGDDAGSFHVSSFAGDGNQFHVSAVQGDAGLLHVSSYSGDANQVHVSAVQGDAGLERISASIFPNTTGGLSIYRSLNLSASQNVKSTAGAIYGWEAWNSALTQQYIKFYNVSGAIAVGTDVPVMTLKLNISGVDDFQTPLGLVGFTNGISIAAISGSPDDNTAVSPASAVGINLFYK